MLFTSDKQLVFCIILQFVIAVGCEKASNNGENGAQDDKMNKRWRNELSVTTNAAAIIILTVRHSTHIFEQTVLYVFFPLTVKGKNSFSPSVH